MSRQTRSWERNVEGLRKKAREKAEATKRRVDEAIRLLIAEQRTINFKTVSEAAHVSTAWLYANEDVKVRIHNLREQQVPRVAVRIPPRVQASSASKDAIIAALQKRVKEQADKISKLQKQAEITGGELQRLYLKMGSSDGSL